MKAIISGEANVKLCPEPSVEKWGIQLNMGWIQLAMQSLRKTLKREKKIQDQVTLYNRFVTK